MKVDKGRTVQVFGPCNRMGDIDQDCCDFIRLFYRTTAAEHYFVIPYDEAFMLFRELDDATTDIQNNRLQRDME